MNTRHKVFRPVRPSRAVIALRLVLMYYAVEIGSSLFLSGYFLIVSGMFSSSFSLVLDVDLSSLFIVGESPYKV
jgi:hypothetical protein